VDHEPRRCPDEDGAAASHRRPVVLVGVDDSESSLSALLYAAGVAETIGGEVVAAHVPPYPLLVGIPTPVSAAGLVMITQGERTKQLEETVGSLLELAGVPWRFVVVEGPIARAFDALATQFDARVIIVGRPRCSIWHRFRHVLVPSVPRSLSGLARDHALLVA